MAGSSSRAEVERLKELGEKPEAVQPASPADSNANLLESSDHATSSDESSDSMGPKGSLKERKLSDISDLAKCPTHSHDYCVNLVGCKITVWCPLEKQFYDGTIQSYESEKRKHKILYDDGDVEMVTLAEEIWREINNDGPAKKRLKYGKRKMTLTQSSLSKGKTEALVPSNNIIRKAAQGKRSAEVRLVDDVNCVHLPKDNAQAESDDNVNLATKKDRNGCGSKSIWEDSDVETLGGNCKKKSLDSALTVKKLKCYAANDKIYTTYIMKKHKTPKRKMGEEPASFVTIGGFFVSYETFQSCFKPRGEVCNEVMSLYTENFNCETQLEGIGKRGTKKFVFPQFLTGQLVQYCATFNPNGCITNFNKIYDKHKLAKFDLLFFPVVSNRHWALCCINLLHKQINIFNSIKNNTLFQGTFSNLIANFTSVTNQSKKWMFDVSSFEQVQPNNYPQQTTIHDCGFFTMLYMENWDGKIMKSFSKDHIPEYRKIIATSFIQSPLNIVDPSWVLSGSK